MKVQGREQGEWGFSKAADGWHLICFDEGIGLLTNKEGEVVKDDKDRDLYKLPATIKDSADESNDISVDQIVVASDFGEQKIADILAAVGLFKKFAEKFPGDVSFFEPKVMEAIKTKLPGKFMKVYTEQTKDGKYTNVTKFAKADAKTDAPPAPKGTKAAPATGGAAAPTGGSWDD